MYGNHTNTLREVINLWSAWWTNRLTHNIFCYAILYFLCGKMMRNIRRNCNEKLQRMHKFVYFKNKFRIRHVVRSGRLHTQFIYGIGVHFLITSTLHLLFSCCVYLYLPIGSTEKKRKNICVCEIVVFARSIASVWCRCWNFIWILCNSKFGAQQQAKWKCEHVIQLVVHMLTCEHA